jgi:1-aminocyclopropane-1-carboxylate deaminase/D-cysteine desulfhydrase-like pyridoxal-dependent ACC family enzyme
MSTCGWTRPASTSASAPAGSRRWKRCASAAASPSPFPAGCSDYPLGGLGFVGFAEEVRQQEAEPGFKFDYIVVCSVTGSTQAAWWWVLPPTAALIG